MTFTLEALCARAGDALLLHFGEGKLIMIDGGPAHTFQESVGPRLRELAGDGTVSLRALVVSHIDDDHIHGVLDLFGQMRENQIPVAVTTLWHNAFDDLLGNAEIASVAATALASVEDSGPGLPNASPEGAAVLATKIDGKPQQPVSRPKVSPEGAAVLASVGQGRKLRDAAKALGILPNDPRGGLLWSQGDARDVVSMGKDLTFRIVAPSKAHIEALQAKWDEDLKKTKAGASALVAYDDVEVTNLSSIVILAEQEGKRMLLTGDARGDHILAGLGAAGLLDAGGGIDVDVLKMPHHGSDRDVAPEFFERVRAQHYVISSNGRDDNPSMATLEMLVAARKGVEIDVYFTYKVEGRGEYLTAHAPEFRQHYPAEGSRSVSVEL